MPAHALARWFNGLLKGPTPRRLLPGQNWIVGPRLQDDMTDFVECDEVGNGFESRGGPQPLVRGARPSHAPHAPPARSRHARRRDVGRGRRSESLLRGLSSASHAASSLVGHGLPGRPDPRPWRCDSLRLRTSASTDFAPSGCHGRILCGSTTASVRLNSGGFAVVGGSSVLGPAAATPPSWLRENATGVVDEAALLTPNHCDVLLAEEVEKVWMRPRFE